MATFALGTTLTLGELVRREAPDGTAADIVDVISEVNEISRFAQWEQCNRITFHQIPRLASEPSGSERMYNQGITPEAGVTEIVTEPTEMLDGLSEVDVKLIQHQPNPAQARAVEDGIYINGMFKTHVSRIFDGNRSTNPLQIDGINNRADYSALTSDYVYDNAGGNASATANKTSIYLIQFGPKMTTFIFPRNDSVGNTMGMPISLQDFGKQIITDSVVTTKKYPAWQTWFEIHFGLAIHDPRTVKRIVNISTSNIDGVDDFSFDEDLLIDATNDFEHGGRGAVIVCNRTIKAQMQKRANEKGNAQYTQDMEGDGIFARKVLRFWGIPIAEVAQITNTQATVS